MIDRFESQPEMLLLPHFVPSPLLDHLLAADAAAGGGGGKRPNV